MKRSFIVFLSLFISLGSIVAGEPMLIMEGVSMHSRILNQEVRFSVCLPEGYYETKQSYPVLYLLHGLGDDETSWLEYGRISQYVYPAVHSHDIVPMIMVMPQGYRNYYVNDYTGSFLYQDMFVKELVPYIDSMFRTIREKGQRALMGYSMGGFGAFMLSVKHPELFDISVPLSMSMRTDSQYIKEEAKGWDVQWGRLFGAPGLQDSARLTTFYRLNSPFHVLDQVPAGTFKSLHLYMDNGDKEQTLCRSNEEFHILLHKKNIQHEYRVRNGGHSFEYWCSALPNALRYISDAFESKDYRGDLSPTAETTPVAENQMKTITAGGEDLTVFVPDDWDRSNRNYPVLYLVGEFRPSWKSSIASLVNQEISDNIVCPMVVVFLPVADTARLNALFPEIERQMRIRKGYRMRAIAGFEAGAPFALSLAINPEQFGACLLSDALMTKSQVTGMLTSLNRESMKRTSVFIEAPDRGIYAEGNGNAHMLLRDQDIQHEYRVREGEGGFEWFLNGLPEMIRFTAKRFHK